MDNLYKYEPEQLDIDISDQADDEHSVTVEVLTSILQGMQKAIYAIAKDEENRYQTVSNPPKEFKQRYAIRCKVPREGSYAQPIEFGIRDTRLVDDAGMESVKKVADKLYACLEALLDGTLEKFEVIRNTALRKQALLAFRSVLPKAGAKWQFKIASERRQCEFLYSTKTSKEIRRFLTPVDSSLQTVTGYLVAMDFDRHRIVLKYPPTDTELECFYNDELEVTLFENRRELLQVTGNVTYESDLETPKKIADVDDIQFLDMSDFTVDAFDVGGKTLEFIEPLVLTTALTESCQFLTLRDDALGIDVVAQTRDELLDELHAELQMLWTTCAMQEDGKLSNEFLLQKKNLLAAIKEVR